MFRRAERDDDFDRQDTPTDPGTSGTLPETAQGQPYDNPYADLGSYGAEQPGGPPPPVFGTQEPAPRSSETSIIASDAVWTGTLRSNGSIQVNGRIEGEIIAAGDVHISRGAEVSSQIQAINVIVAGTFKGGIACTGRFEAMDTGNIEGRILAPTLVVHEGATITGTFRMRRDSDDDVPGQSDDVTGSGE